MSMSETPMGPERLAEIRAARAALNDTPWGAARDLAGSYTVQAGALVTDATSYLVATGLALRRFHP